VSDELDGLVRELEDVAARLRSEELPPEEAAALVERCAELAARVGSELDAQARAASEAEGQERLL
jgi:predicted DNA-binding transcriptional regulator YafY